MKAFWFGASAGPSTTAARYTCLSASFPLATSLWLASELNLNALSENITITKLTVWVTTEPGASKSWAFTLRNNLANTVATATISGSNTSASWTGSLNLSAGDSVGLLCVPAGTPAASGTTHWAIEYETAGNFYLILGGSTVVTSITSTNYQNPFGVTTTAPSATESATSGIVADALSVTRLAVRARGAVSGGRYDVSVRRGLATDSAKIARVSFGDQVAVSDPFSLAFSTYDFISIKTSPSGPPDANAINTCMTVVPGTSGRILICCSVGMTSDNLMAYYPPLGLAQPSTVESNVHMRVPACTIDQMAARTLTAPGAGKGRLITVRSNGIDTALAATISDTFNAANPQTDVTHGDGHFLSISQIGSGTPPVGNVKVALLLSIPQDDEEVNTTNFFF